MDWKTLPPRPRRIGDEGRLTVATELVNDLIDGGHLKEENRSRAIEDIRRHATFRMNGYDLAKTLDDRARWEIDADMVEVLDSYSSLHDIEVEKLVVAWVEENSIEPEFAAGDAVLAVWGGEEVQGTIDSVNPHAAASYLVLPPDGSKHPAGTRLYVDFEKASPRSD